MSNFRNCHDVYLTVQNWAPHRCLQPSHALLMTVGAKKLHWRHLGLDCWQLNLKNSATKATEKTVTTLGELSYQTMTNAWMHALYLQTMWPMGKTLPPAYLTRITVLEKNTKSLMAASNHASQFVSISPPSCSAVPEIFRENHCWYSSLRFFRRAKISWLLVTTLVARRDFSCSSPFSRPAAIARLKYAQFLLARAVHGRGIWNLQLAEGLQGLSWGLSRRPVSFPPIGPSCWQRWLTHRWSFRYSPCGIGWADIANDLSGRLTMCKHHLWITRMHRSMPKAFSLLTVALTSHPLLPTGGFRIATVEQHDPRRDWVTSWASQTSLNGAELSSASSIKVRFNISAGCRAKIPPGCWPRR